MPANRLNRRILEEDRVCDAIGAIGDRKNVVAWAGRFGLLSDPSRLALLLSIAHAGPISVTDLAVATDINETTVSQSLGCFGPLAPWWPDATVGSSVTNWLTRPSPSCCIMCRVRRRATDATTALPRDVYPSEVRPQPRRQGVRQLAAGLRLHRRTPVQTRLQRTYPWPRSTLDRARHREAKGLSRLPRDLQMALSRKEVSAHRQGRIDDRAFPACS